MTRSVAQHLPPAACKDLGTPSAACTSGCSRAEQSWEESGGNHPWNLAEQGWGEVVICAGAVPALQGQEKQVPKVNPKLANQIHRETQACLPPLPHSWGSLSPLCFRLILVPVPCLVSERLELLARQGWAQCMGNPGWHHAGTVRCRVRVLQDRLLRHRRSAAGFASRLKSLYPVHDSPPFPAAAPGTMG